MQDIHGEAGVEDPGVGESHTVTVKSPHRFGLQRGSHRRKRRLIDLTFAGDTTDGAGDATWNTPRTITVTGPDDENAVQETVTITHTIGGAIVGNGILTATIRESDTRGVTITPTSVEVTEGGTAVYNVVLDSQPFGGSDTAGENRVTVTVGGASGDVTVDAVPVALHG